MKREPLFAPLRAPCPVFEMVRTIGAGGMGEVFLARDPRLGREVATAMPSAQVKIAGESGSDSVRVDARTPPRWPARRDEEEIC